LGNEILKIRLIDWKSTCKEAEKLLELLGVHVDVTQPVKSCRRLISSWSLLPGIGLFPKLLILDEPTAVLTKNEKENLFKSMRKLKENGTTMVFISHHLDEVMELTDRVTIMRDGHVVKVVNTNEITKDEMINLMAGKKLKKQNG